MCLLALAWMKWILSALKLILVSPQMLVLSRMWLYFLFFFQTAMIKQTFVIICRGRRCVGEPCAAGEETCVFDSRHTVKFLKMGCWCIKTVDHASLAVNVYSSSRTSVSVWLILNMTTWIQQCLIITQVPILHRTDGQHIHLTNFKAFTPKTQDHFCVLTSLQYFDMDGLWEGSVSYRSEC